jgi:hypothetical protein
MENMNFYHHLKIPYEPYFSHTKKGRHWATFFSNYMNLNFYLLLNCDFLGHLLVA